MRVISSGYIMMFEILTWPTKQNYNQLTITPAESKTLLERYFDFSESLFFTAEVKITIFLCDGEDLLNQEKLANGQIDQMNKC